MNTCITKSEQNTSYFGYVLSEMVVGAPFDAMADVIMAFVADTNVFASLTTALEFPVPLAEFGYS